MKFLYNLDGALWVVNAVMWGWYAHVAVMVVGSLVAAGTCFFLATKTEF